ncbi:MAG: polyphosphate kinase 1 [Clostridiaceae bacterium]|nr:polyphosphate kinase 1 [Clostridiaceae bacterium]
METPSIYVNRELSWLKFNERVLEESMCAETPLYERLRFIAIFESNYDEFFMIRVGTLYDQALLAVPFLDTKTHMTPVEQLDAIYARTRELVARRDACYDAVTEALAREGVVHLRHVTAAADRRAIDSVFEREIQPLLSPAIVDSRHPFPHLPNKQLYVAVRLAQQGSDEPLFGLIPIPAALDRVIFLPGDEQHRYVLTEDVIAARASKVFPMYKMCESVVFCVTRNADINTDEQLYNQDADYRDYMKEILRKRKRLAAVRLEMLGGCSDQLREYFMDKLRLREAQVFTSTSPLDMRYVNALGDRLPSALTKQLSWTPHHPRYPAGLSPKTSMIRRIQHGDLLLNYPYDSFKPFVSLIREASEDKYVTSIKLTLYRVGRESRIIDSLINAAENGKDVTILLELRARFDEENNINWAQKLEEAGVRILYGPDGFKVHSKICLITRREKGRVSYITQVGTGNYNEKTTNIYTDYSLMTANSAIAADALMLFNNLSTGVLGDGYQTLLVAPHCMRTVLLRAIDTEIEKARLGRGGEILIKVNSITDNVLIDALVRASQAGVRIRMIVRGICCILPGVPGMTDNVSIISIVGRYLEHSRVYCFGSGADRKVYLASADFMTRNMQRRIEVAVPLLDPAIARRVYEDVEASLSDNAKARVMHPDGTYSLRYDSVSEAFNSQEYFRQRAEAGAASVKSSLFSRFADFIKTIPPRKA